MKITVFKYKLNGEWVEDTYREDEPIDQDYSDAIRYDHEISDALIEGRAKHKASGYIDELLRQIERQKQQQFESAKEEVISDLIDEFRNAVMRDKNV
jgi:hypothetical protein